MAVEAVAAVVAVEAMEAEAEVAAVVTTTSARVCFMQTMENPFSMGLMSLTAPEHSHPLKSASWTQRLGLTSATG